MGIFKRKKEPIVDSVEFRFELMVEVVKGLSKTDLNKLKKSMDRQWESQHIFKSIKTGEEELDDIDEAEKQLEKELAK